MGKPLSWKWKLTLLFVFSFVFGIIYLFTDGCNDLVVGKLNEYYKDTPPEERRNSSLAQWYLRWAYFRGSTLGDYKTGYVLYRDFLGIPKNTWAADTIFNAGANSSKKELGTGKASPDWQQGWGILHPDAADAFYEYICMMEPYESGVNTARESKAYYMYLYTLHMKKSPDHLPHPLFAKYWPKVRQKILNGRVGVGDIPNYDFNAKKAAPYVEPKE